MLPKGLKLLPLRTLEDQQAESLPQARQEELQARSLAAFTWRTLEALREVWSLTMPGGRVEIVMCDSQQKCGYVLSRSHIENLPFPWPEVRTAFYFFVPGMLAPIPMWTRDSRRALGDDGVSVRAAWVFECIEWVLMTFGGGADRKPGSA